MCKFLGCLVDVAWYVEHSPLGVLNIASAQAIEHYVTHAASVCWPPNSYFMEHKDQLYNQGTCLMYAWAKGETSDYVLKLLDGYAEAKPQDFQAFARQAVKKPSGLISVLNADYLHLSSSLTKELAKCSLCIGALSDVSFFENWLGTSPVPEEVLSVLIEHATLYDGLPSTLITLSKAMLEDRFAKHRQSVMSKLVSLASEGHAFPAAVFGHIEQLIVKGGDHVMDSMRLVVFGIKEGLHAPSEQSVSWCKQLLEHSLEKDDTMLANLALDALTVTAIAWFSNPDKVEEIVTYIIANEYRFVQTKYTMRLLFQKLVMGNERHEDIADKICAYDSSVPEFLLNMLGKWPQKSDVKSADVFLSEAIDLNANNPSISKEKLLELVEYVKVQLPEVHAQSRRFKFHDARLIIFQRQKPIEIQPNELHVYSNVGKLFMRVFDKSGLLIDEPLPELSEVQVARISRIISGTAKSTGRDLDAIYKATDYLEQWSDEQFSAWAHKNKVIDDSNIAEVIAVLNYAYYLTKAKQKFFMRDQQIIAVLMLFKSSGGRILEIETGGGKTAIIAIFSAIRAMLKLSTHIITTSGDLAMRDATSHRSFFSKLGLKVKDNLPRRDEPQGIRTCYDANPVYCDMRQLLGDFLRNLDETVMRGGDVNAIVLDEVDALLIDHAIASGTKVQLSASSPGFEYLRGIQQAIWWYSRNIREMLSVMKFEYSQELEAYCRSKEDSDQTECLSVEDIYNWLKGAIEAYILENLNSPSMPTPSHLSDFLQGHVKRWADSVIKAITQNSDEEYTLYEPKPNTTVSIVPIDLKNGVLQPSLKWSDGLHQYLQPKHALQHTAEGLTNLFVSYYGYFLKYRGNIFGLTGTVGASWHQKFLFEVYGVDSIKLPTFAKSKRVSMPEIVAPNADAWLKAIVNETMQVAGKNQRAVLIIAPTISMMQIITEALKAQYSGKILQYFNALEQKDFFEMLIKPGYVIVSTNAAGRGVDPEISRVVEVKGGLHVIMPSFSDFLRVYQQGTGRSARKGQRGSDRLIINALNHPELSKMCNFTCLLKMRDDNEIQDLKYMQSCSLPGYALEAELFAKHVSRVRADTSATGFDIVLAVPGPDIKPGTLYLYPQGDSLFMHSLNILSINVTEPFTMLDVTVLSHIWSTFGRAGSALNSQAHEMAHFIAANFSLSSDPYVLGRIIVRYEEAWREGKVEGTFPGFCPQEQNFLAGLITQNLTFDLLMQAKYQELYRLWREDRALYNKRSYIQHRKERFGIFYKDNMYLMSQTTDCNSTDEEGEQQRARAEHLRNKSDAFFSAESNNTNVANPAYLLHEAYALESIEAQQPQRRAGRVNFRGAYGFIKSSPRCEVPSFEPPQDTSGILGTLFGIGKKVYSGIMSLVPGEAKRVFASLFEAKVELQDLYLFDTLKGALDLTLKAVSADSFFNWWSYNTLAYMRLRHDGDGITEYSQGAEAGRVIRAFAEDTSYTLRAFNQYLPLLEFRLLYLLQQRITTTGDPLAVQMKTEIEMYKGQIRTLQHNLDRVKEAAENFNDNAPSMLRVGRMIDFIDLVNHTAVNEFAQASSNITSNHTAAVNFTQLMRREFNISIHASSIALEMYAQGGFAFEVYVEELHDDRDWTETIMSGFLGVLFIVMGIALMPGAGVFMTSFASSIIAGGVADMVGSIAAFMRGTPIQMSQYFKGKVISMAASLLAAGVLKGLSEIDKLNKLFKISETAEKFSKTFKEVLPLYLTTQFAVSAATQLAYAAISKQAERYVDKNSGAIKADSKALVARILERQYDQHLKRILAYDLFIGQRNRAQMIETQAQSITRDYSKRFRSSGAQTARQAAGQTVGALAGGFGPAGAALGTAISSGIEVGLGVVKFSEAADDFEPNLIESIGNVAAGTPTTAELMRLHLARHSDSLISTQADAIMAQLGTTSFIVAGEINYANCEQIGDLPLGAFESFGLQLYKDCMRVRKLMSREAQTDVYAQLQENLAQTLFASLQDILKMDIASPLSSVAASAAAGMVTSTIQKHLEEAKARILAESKRRELATEEYQTTTNKDSDPGKSSNAQGQAKPSGKSSAKPKPETLNFAPMRNKAKASSRTVPKSGQTHKVEPGDTVDAIAKKYGTTVEAITQANPWLKEHTFTDNHGRTIITIKPGEQIVIHRYSDSKIASASSKYSSDKVCLPNHELVPACKWHSPDHPVQPLEDKLKHSSISLAHDKVKGKALMAGCEAVFKKTLEKAENIIKDFSPDNVEVIDARFISDGIIGSLLLKIKFEDGTSRYAYTISGVEPVSSKSAETVADLYDYAAALYGRIFDEVVTRGSYSVGASLDALNGGSITSEPDYLQYDKSQLINYAFKTRPTVHISRIKSLREKYGINEKIIVAGFSGGGLEAQMLRALAPDLVGEAYAYDAPGAGKIINTITKGDQALMREIYKDIHIINFDSNAVNRLGTHPSFTDISHIPCEKHAMISGIVAFKANGILHTGYSATDKENNPK